MFETIKRKVADSFGAMQRAPLIVDLPHNTLFDAYLAALPEAVRQEHNCNCCKAFLNHYGAIVTVENGAVKTLWQFEVAAPYDKVPATLDAIVRNSAISRPFLSHDRNLGTDFNVQMKGEKTIRWEHFHVLNSSLLPKSVSVESAAGKLNSTRAVFERALREIPAEVTETVLELIAQNSLYRGAEYKSTLQAFLKHQKAAADPAMYSWEHINEAVPIRSTAIGTLLVDLAEGRDLNAAVGAYEAKVAPANYRRPTALVTKGMLDKAEETIKDLGLELSLYRRHANTDDIPVSEVLFVDRAVKDSGGLFDTLREQVEVKSFGKVEEITVGNFIKDVLPTITGMEVLLENKHTSKLMNLTAPAHEEAPTLFNWDNGIAWVYKDGNADSIKERVKAAGGSVDGELRVSLSWRNYDDLDLHITEPKGNKIWYRERLSPVSGGNLDVDENVGRGKTRTPVENIIFPGKQRMLDGEYVIIVNNYCKREGENTGFEIEVECRGEVFSFEVPCNPDTSKNVLVARLHYSKEKGLHKVESDLQTGSRTISKEVFGLNTNRFHKVSMVLPSPNHWAGNKGNLHTFFILDKARTEEEIRGFFNEFLKPELSVHRKVFELLGSKVKVSPSAQQLAGLGFSSTQRAELICRVTGNFTRVLKIKF